MLNEYQPDFSSFTLSEEQKFLFDLKGYLVIPNVFNEEEVAAMKQQVYEIHHGQERNKRPNGTLPGGAAEAIFKHPVVLGTLKELIGPDIRLDNLFSIWREKGQAHSQGPHQGGPMRNPHFHYHFTQGQPFAGLTRMVVELNPVGKEDGGTVFLPGSHKANYPIPSSFQEKIETYGSHFEGYECPPGSLLFFSENTCHAGPQWKNPTVPRVSLFFAFCDIGMRWHRYHYVDQEVIDGLGPEARWFFRDIFPWDNKGHNRGKNVLLVQDDGTYQVSPTEDLV